MIRRRHSGVANSGYSLVNTLFKSRKLKSKLESQRIQKHHHYGLGNSKKQRIIMCKEMRKPVPYFGYRLS